MQVVTTPPLIILTHPIILIHRLPDLLRLCLWQYFRQYL